MGELKYSTISLEELSQYLTVASIIQFLHKNDDLGLVKFDRTMLTKMIDSRVFHIDKWDILRTLHDELADTKVSKGEIYITVERLFTSKRISKERFNKLVCSNDTIFTTEEDIVTLDVKLGSVLRVMKRITLLTNEAGKLYINVKDLNFNFKMLKD